MSRTRYFLSDAQLHSELMRCEYCEEKPCREACPADCSPADFIMAARKGYASDYCRAAALILGANPLGGVCGAVCPDYLCMKACARRLFDHPINIPVVQATLIKKGKEVGLQHFDANLSNGMHVAVVGSGPGGLGAASVLAQKGYRVTVFDKAKNAGGMCNLIPDSRLDKRILKTDIAFLKTLGDIKFRLGETVDNIDTLSANYEAVIIASGLDQPIKLQVPGEESTVQWETYLSNSKKYKLHHKRVAVVGGGAIAVDCATAAKLNGAATVDLLYRRKQENMPLTGFERSLLLEHGIDVIPCVKVKRIVIKAGKVKGVELLPLILPAGKKPLPKNFIADPETKPFFKSYDFVILAIGSRSQLFKTQKKNVFYAGDMVHGAATVVEAVASGKNAALAADAYLNRTKPPKKEKFVKSRATLAGRVLIPIPLKAEFFGRPISSPFLLSAAPHTDGYDQMAKAYQAGWAGGVMKTAFDNLPIHIPGGYMFVLDDRTYGNCDNVSGHALDRVCREVEKLVKEFPDRLTMASTGGPVTGNDDADMRVWQSNTKKLESAGAMAVEYSLSCPQGGDGTKGDIVSQDAETTAKVIEWILMECNPDVPKLFKLSGAVTSIRVIMQAVKDVLQKYPKSKAGVTLANSFPTLAFRATTGRNWEEGIIVGMSGEGVLPISNLTLAKVAGMDVAISGNGGPMDYKAAANFLALGASTVQFCTIVMKYGLNIIDELHSGISYLLQDRNIASVRELTGSAIPGAITPFESLSAIKQIPTVVKDLCEHCGNCSRCPYQAIEMNRRKLPMIDASRCIGCSLCVQKCFSGALLMRDRTEQETSVMMEL
jgi:NADPH-dependent glutamate synthase beta subunit-like oxidoreductase/dihydroorotate dehydrogenase/Pyruvate/2-oxoacid:ferredoxin oxidoreductase delta subunit